MSPSKQGKRWRSEPSPTPHYHGTQNRIRLPLQEAPSFKSQFQNCLLIVHVCILYQGRFFIFFQRQLHIQSFTGINPDVTKTKQQAQFLHQPKQGTNTSGKNFHLDFTPAHPPFPCHALTWHSSVLMHHQQVSDSIGLAGTDKGAHLMPASVHALSPRKN